MKVGRGLFVIYCFLIAFSILGSAASVWLALDPGPIAPIAGFCLILSGAFCLGVSIGGWRPFLFVMTISTSSELIGLIWGYPFGRYEYTDAWWPTVSLGSGNSFPLLLPFAWVLIVFGSYLTVRPFTRGWRTVVLAGLLASLIDAPMERAMAEVFNYWTWIDGGPIFGAPLLNFVGWFAVSTLATVGVAAWARPTPSVHGPRVLALFCLFIAAVGALEFADAAWPLLAVYGVALWWVSLHVRRSIPNASATEDEFRLRN